MPRNKSPKKRKQHKPGKPGRSPADGRIPYRRYPKRFMVSAPPEHGHETPHEFFYDSPEEAIQHCVRLGPQFFLDTLNVAPLEGERHGSAVPMVFMPGSRLYTLRYVNRSEERRVGKECRSRCWWYHCKKKH